MQSITVYLSALRHLQIAAGLQAPPQSFWAWLQYVIRGIKCSQSPSPRVRLPITASILGQLLNVWTGLSGKGPRESYETCLLWATACTAFFGFLRLGELLPVPVSTPSPLLLLDLAVNSHSAPSVICLSIRRAKNDPLGTELQLPWDQPAHLFAQSQLC